MCAGRQRRVLWQCPGRAGLCLLMSYWPDACRDRRLCCCDCDCRRFCCASATATASAASSAAATAASASAAAASASAAAASAAAAQAEDGAADEPVGAEVGGEPNEAAQGVRDRRTRTHRTHHHTPSHARQSHAHTPHMARIACTHRGCRLAAAARVHTCATRGTPSADARPPPQFQNAVMESGASNA